MKESKDLKGEETREKRGRYIVYVCVCDRERERGGGGEREG